MGVDAQEGKLERAVFPLLKWYQENARVLPWRTDHTPYRVWVSEIMLQQTRVAAVIGYFERFMAALPTPQALAEVPEDALMKLWQGLGYYNRARNLQKAARQIVTDYGGELPPDYDAIRALPGVGDYTAGAIASIAFGLPVPAVDGNVLRVISRILGDGRDIGRQDTKNAVRELLLTVIPREAPGQFNQALMELGAVVCLPNGAPQCEQCPVRELCAAHLEERTAELPVKAAKKKRRIEERRVWLIFRNGRVALRRRPSKGLLAGLYELPNTEGHLTQEQALKETASFGFSPIRIRPLEDAKHIFSHVEWQMKGYLVLVEEQEEAGGGILFVEPERTERDYPIPAAFAAYAKYLKIRLGQEKYKDKG